MLLQSVVLIQLIQLILQQQLGGTEEDMVIEEEGVTIMDGMAIEETGVAGKIEVKRDV